MWPDNSLVPRRRQQRNFRAMGIMDVDQTRRFGASSGSSTRDIGSKISAFGAIDDNVQATAPMTNGTLMLGQWSHFLIHIFRFFYIFLLVAPVNWALRASLGLDAHFRDLKRFLKASSADSALEFLGVHYTYHRLPLADEEDWVADRVVRTDSDMMLQLNNRWSQGRGPKCAVRNFESGHWRVTEGIFEYAKRVTKLSEKFPGYIYLARLAWAWVVGREMETRGKPQRTPTPGFSGGSGVMGEIKNYAGYSRTDTGDQLSLKPDLETVPVPGTGIKNCIKLQLQSEHLQKFEHDVKANGGDVMASNDVGL
ncbi:hypothetical protein K438DRAFT_1764287 [Mycena galopus ATCC 62051]|nr:hypothetical protein K438DRAFT_1764287 [Mycena galopus ATCC 62051]